ncbi:hypothetical protein [Halopseudomonas sp.]|jgi:hypothetical protein|uniref:hypothetical protein n=1 Tax=Halopseudomonas sp. TaxID=2901191 RepID=UPI0039E663E6
MKIKGRYFSLGSVVALAFLLAAGPGVASPDKAKQKAAPPERPKAMREVVLMREQVRPLGESIQSKKIRAAKKHPGKEGFREAHGLRAKRPALSSNSIVVVPGEFGPVVKERVVPPGKGRPPVAKGNPKAGNGKPKGNDKSAKLAR